MCIDCYLAPIIKKAVCFMLGLRTVCVVVSVLGGLDINVCVFSERMKMF